MDISAKTLSAGVAVIVFTAEAIIHRNLMAGGLAFFALAHFFV